MDFTCTLTRDGKGGRTWSVETEGGSVAASFEGGHVTAELSDGADQSREVAFDVEGELPFFFENLVFGCLYEAGRDLIARAEADDLKDGATLTAILAQAGRTLPFTLKSHARDEEGIWTFTILFPPGLDMTWTCGEDALPITIDVPAQKLEVRREGAAPDGPGEGRSPVCRGPWRAKLSQPTFEVETEEAVEVPMRDGVVLVVDLYRPAAEGKYPTILIRTPYDRHNEGLANGARFAKRGYAVVVQDVRGRFDSGGEFFPLIHEMEDGSDTLDWIAAQPWSDGKVGMIGASYVGWVQWYAAKSRNPHLLAIIPQVSPPDPDQNIPYEGGAFLLGSAWWASALTYMDQGGFGIPEKDYETILATLPLSDLDEAIGTDQPFLDVWLSHPPDDEEFWGPQRYQNALETMNVAALHLTGWYDGDQPGALQNFPVLRRHGATERVRTGQFLIVGPWGHGFNLVTKLGDVDFGPESVIDRSAVEVRFFDHYLKGIDNGVEREKPVWVFVMGENAWHNEESWPLPGTRFTPLYLSSEGDATRRGGGGKVGFEKGKGSEASTTIAYDPMDIPKLGLDWTDVTGDQATMDVNAYPDRADDLEFDSAPLAAPVELTGPFEALLYVRSDVQDADFVVSILKLGLDGSARRIATGIQRMRYRNGKDDPVPPGEVATLHVDCWASGIRLAKGERLRIQVTSTGFPGYARNSGTLEPIADAKRLLPAHNELLHSAEYPSQVILPVVPRPDAPELRFEEQR